MSKRKGKPNKTAAHATANRDVAPAARLWGVRSLLVLSAWSSLAALPVQSGSNTGRVIAILLLAAGWLAYFAARPAVFSLRWRKPFTIALAALAGAIIAASALSPYAARSLTWGSISFFGAPVWLGLIAIVLFTASTFSLVSWRMTIAAAVGWTVPSLAIAGYEFASRQPLTGGLNTGNHFGALMVSVTPILWWLASDSRGRPRAAWGILAAATAGAVVLSRSSAAALGLAVAACVASVLAPDLFGEPGSQSRRWGRLAVWITAGLAVFVLGAALMAPAAMPESVVSYVRGDVFGTTFQTRVEMWKAAWATFLDRPLIGFGADSYHLAAQPHFSGRMFELEGGVGLLAAPPDPHSLPALFAAQFGGLGLLAGLAVCVTWGIAVLARVEDEPQNYTQLRRASAAGAVGFLSSMLFLPWAVVLGAFPAVVAGVAIALPARESGGGPNAAGRGASLLLAVALGALALTLFAGVLSLNSAADATTREAASRSFSAAAGTLPTYPYPRLMGLHLEGEQLRGSDAEVREWQARVDADADMTADATYSILLLRDSLDQAYRWTRSDLRWERALLTRLQGRFPQSPEGRAEEAHYLVLSGDAEAAERLLDDLERGGYKESRLYLYKYYVAVAQGRSAEAAQMRFSLESEFGSYALLDPQPR